MDAEPIAWAVFSERGREAVYAADLRQHAERACLLNGWRLVPIYETPPGGTGTGLINRPADPRREVFDSA